jgi:glycosyltransferase involved in cell wall biosynthesis
MDMPPVDQRDELVIVMPVYNEEESISKVIFEWQEELSRWTNRFHLLVINDGSTDNTRQLLQNLAKTSNTRIKIINQENAGHGQTCLRGYAWAIEQNVPYVLQIDSDGQCDPQFFGSFWAARNNYHVIYGRRTKRDDGFFRVLASWIMKLSLFLFSGVWCADPNVPYRFMHTRILPPFLTRVPSDFNLANVALAVLLRKTPGIRHGYVKIRFRQRYGGVPSVSFTKFLNRGFQLIRQIRTLR